MSEQKYNKNNPFLASIKERYSLCGPHSLKDTHHIVLDLKGSNITYDVGDSIAIFPQNDPSVVEKTLQALKLSGHEKMEDKNNVAWDLKTYLAQRANITEISRKLLNEVRVRQTNAEKQEKLDSLFSEENREHLKVFLEKHHLWEILSEHPEITFTAQEICQLLMPLLPRFYSIASSQHMAQEEIHLTVALLKFSANGLVKTGVCTHYLCHQAPLHQPALPVYIQPHHGFTLPHDEAPIIMVGPGTGIAPFRAFMQERLAKKAPGRNWLFFGECHRSSNFFYETFWNELSQQNMLKLDLAFSRDQEYKVYVQHRMLEQGAELFNWLNQGAYFYVCGDAKNMAKDVENSLLQIIQKHGRHNEEEAKAFLKKLRQEKRYLRDVY